MKAISARNAIGSPLGALVASMNAAGSCLVLLIMVVILVDVFGRFLFNKPLPGTPEIVAMSIVAVVYLQFPSTLRAHRVINSDGFLTCIAARSVRCEQYLLAGYHALGGMMFLIVCRYVAPLAAEVFDNGDYYGTPSVFSFPKWPVYAVVAFGCAIMALQYVVLTVEYARAGWGGRQLFEVDPAMKVLS
jgi:TRAP-type C4-dicarboxylate transport system permease small subunit